MTLLIATQQTTWSLSSSALTWCNEGWYNNNSKLNVKYIGVFIGIFSGYGTHSNNLECTSLDQMVATSLAWWIWSNLLGFQSMIGS